ncbi:MAG: hypothetical protein DRQ47_04045, partial [Gammaproteobacteria bacterium]
MLLALLLWLPIQATGQEQEQEQEQDQKINQQTCISCHLDEQQSWEKSDHFKAMAIPDESSVVGDFNQKQISHYQQKATFFRENGLYKVTISYAETYAEKSQTFEIKYSFGHYPLQQYLVETEKGRLQVLPFAWDAREKDQGGQTW